MAYIVKMPKFGMKMNQGTVLEWLVSPGETVTEGTPLAEVESEKNVAEIEASEDGTLRLIYVSEGEAVEPGTPLGIITGPRESLNDLESEIDLNPVATAETDDTAIGDTDDAEVSDPETGEDAGGTRVDTDRIRASPRAKRRADELNVSLADVVGSGPGGAITVEDVEAASGSPESSNDGEPTEAQDPETESRGA